MRINLFDSTTGAGIKAIVALQVVLVIAAAGALFFLYGEMGPLLKERAELLGDLERLGTDIASHQKVREDLRQEVQSLEARLERLQAETARISADRAVLSASFRRLAGDGERAAEIVESTAAAEQADRRISPRIYVHVATDSGYQQASRLVAELEKGGFIVPSVQRVRAVPTTPQLRFFSRNDEEPARRAFAIAQRHIPRLELRPFETRDLQSPARPLGSIASASRSRASRRSMWMPSRSASAAR